MESRFAYVRYTLAATKQNKTTVELMIDKEIPHIGFVS